MSLEAPEKKGLLGAGWRVQSINQMEDKFLVKIWTLPIQAMDSRIFFFDDLFDSQATDDEIFTSVQDELDAAVAGEAVCILAYGATGSGKTHTVTNLAHRAAVELERQATALANGGMKLEITVQLVEIYNDQLRDLLAEGEQPRLRLSVSSSGSALLGAVSQQITADSNGGIAKMLGQVLRIGQAQRATFNTALNVRLEGGSAEVISALQRLYGGDVSASRELEAFQVSPGALELSVKLLASSVPEAGSNSLPGPILCRVHRKSHCRDTGRTGKFEDSRADVNLLLGQAIQLTSPSSAPARRQLVHAAATLGAGLAHARELMREETWQVKALELTPTTTSCGVLHGRQRPWARAPWSAPMWAQRWCRASGVAGRHFSEKVSKLALQRLLLLESKPEKQTVQSILEEELPRLANSTDLTTSTLSLLSEHGRPDIIDQIIELLRPEGLQTIPCNVAISAHARRTSWQNALRIFQSMQSWRICRSSVSFNACAKALERGSLWQLAVDLFEKLTATLEPDALSYSIALSSLERGHQWQLALQLYSEIPSEVADLVCLNSTISACAKGRAWHIAMTLFDVGSLRFEPDVVTYGAAITAAGASVSHAMELLEEMTSRRIRRNTTVYNATIAACVAGSDWRLALRLFREMPLLKLLSDVYTYNSGISASSKGRAWETALQLFFDMTRRFLRPSAISYNAAIGALESQWSKALHLYVDMQNRSIEPDSYTFTALLKALEESGAWALALDIFSTMRRFELQADVYSCSACIGSLSERRWDLALDLFTSMPVMRIFPNLVAYNAAISASAHGRHWQLAIHYVEVLQTDPLLPGPDAISYNTAIHACGSSGKEHAWRMFQEMRKERLDDAVTYNTILTGICDVEEVNMDVKMLVLMGR
eukprot:s284_g28.t1